MKKKNRILVVVLLVLLLIAVRAFIEPLFYDPLIDFYKSNYFLKPIPELNLVKYFFNIFLRYSLNSILSIFIIFLIYNNFKTIRFVIKFYFISFIVLCILLYGFLLFDDLNTKLIIFYVRRFLIQPLFLFILVPAFYYQKLKLAKGN